MLGRLTETEPEDWPTVPVEMLVRHAVADPSEMCDDEPQGRIGGTFYPDDGLLVLTYQKHGETYAEPDVECDCAGHLIETSAHEWGCRTQWAQTTEYADTGLGLLTVDRVVELVWEAGRMDTKEDVREWVLGKLG